MFPWGGLENIFPPCGMILLLFFASVLLLWPPALMLLRFLQDEQLRLPATPARAGAVEVPMPGTNARPRQGQGGAEVP